MKLKGVSNISIEKEQDESEEGNKNQYEENINKLMQKNKQNQKFSDAENEDGDDEDATPKFKKNRKNLLDLFQNHYEEGANPEYQKLEKDKDDEESDEILSKSVNQQKQNNIKVYKPSNQQKSVSYLKKNEQENDQSDEECKGNLPIERFMDQFTNLLQYQEYNTRQQNRLYFRTLMAQAPLNYTAQELNSRLQIKENILRKQRPNLLECTDDEQQVEEEEQEQEELTQKQITSEQSTDQENLNSNNNQNEYDFENDYENISESKKVQNALQTNNSNVQNNIDDEDQNECINHNIKQYLQENSNQLD